MASHKPGWPENVTPITLEAMDHLGLDEENKLYWRGKPIEIQRKFKFTFWQTVGAVIVGSATILGGIGSAAQGLAAYSDYACKVGWRSPACPPKS